MLLLLEGKFTGINAKGLFVSNRQAKVLVHDLRFDVLGRCFKVADLRRRDHDVDDVAGRWLALPYLELQLAHDIVELGRVGPDVDAIHFPVIVADLLRD